MVLVDSIVSPSLYWGVRTHTDHRVGALLAILGPMKEFEVGPPTAPNIYCQDPALTVLSVLFLFNVSLFVLCLSTWLCLCLCLPCAPPVPPPCFPWSHPLCFVLVLSSFAWWCSPEPRVICCFIWCSFPLCLCLFFLVFLVLFLGPELILALALAILILLKLVFGSLI